MNDTVQANQKAGAKPVKVQFDTTVQNGSLIDTVNRALLKSDLRVTYTGTKHAQTLHVTAPQNKTDELVLTFGRASQSGNCELRYESCGLVSFVGDYDSANSKDFLKDVADFATGLQPA